MTDQQQHYVCVSIVYTRYMAIHRFTTSQANIHHGLCVFGSTVTRRRRRRRSWTASSASSPRTARAARARRASRSSTAWLTTCSTSCPTTTSPSRSSSVCRRWAHSSQWSSSLGRKLTGARAWCSSLILRHLIMQLRSAVMRCVSKVQTLNRL